MQRLIFAVVILISLTTDNWVWGQVATQPAAAANSNDGESQAARLDAVFQEMSKMVPGGVAAGSPTETALQEAIAQFADRKPLEAQQSLKDLTEADDNFPPSDLMLAALAYAINDNTSGRGLLEQAALNSADYPDVYFSFGQLALTQRRFTDAEAHAEFALQKIKAGSFNQLQIDHFKQRYYEIKFQIAKARGRLVKAKEFLQQLESVAPNAPQTLIGKAELAFEDKDIDKTLGFLQQLNSISEGKSRAPELTIAGWFQRKGKIQNADLWIRKAAAQNLNDAVVQLAAARWLLNRENFSETLKAVETMESISGETNTSQDIRGKVAFAQGAYATAEAQFESLLTENPGNIDYANMLALSMVQSTDEEKRKKAFNLAKKVASAQPNNAIALSSLAYVMLKSGETEGARSILAKVAQLPNPNAEVSFIMAYMLYQTGQMPQAKIVLDKVVNTKGLFLFRGEAEKLLKTVEQSSQGLPEPG